MNFKTLNRRFGLLTISSVFLLLLAGGVVRSTGSGMGCPDWPKCFEKYVPPTDSSQLPAGYKDIHLAKRLKKAIKFSKLLEKIGFEKEAKLLLQDPSLYVPEDFNTRKAWTEYINRLIGALSGVFALGFFITLFKAQLKTDKLKFWCGIFGFILMLFNGWLGSIVVATNLVPVLVTIHYLAAYAALSFFMISVFSFNESTISLPLKKFKWFYVFILVLTLIQISYGTQLRQSCDLNDKKGLLVNNNRINTDVLGADFSIHLVLAIVLIVLTLIPVFINRKKINSLWLKILLIIPLTFMLQYLSGVLNVRYNFPVVAQVSHVFFAGIVYAVSLYICIANFSKIKHA